MKRTPRVLAAVVAATALTFTGVHTADAKPDRAGTHAKAEKAAKAKAGKGSLSKLERDAARVEAQLDKATGAKRLERLDQADRDAVLANVELDKAALAEAGTRADLRAFRVEHYRLVVNVLRKAAKLRAAATESGVEVAPAEILAAVAAITAQTPKADARTALAAARAALSATAELLDTDGDEGEDESLDLDDAEDPAGS